MKKVDLIIDLQFGSTGKGLIAGYLASNNDYDTVINANMPNAGHTFIDKEGNVYVHKVLPNGIVGKNVEKVMIGPGSVFSLKQLEKELYHAAAIMGGQALMIHENAVILTDEHRKEEQQLNDISSTMQGSAAAMADKIWRRRGVIAKDALIGTDFEGCIYTNDQWLFALVRADKVLAEGAQGFSLGINAGFYPYCTSRDCTPTRFLADMGIPHYMLNKVIGTARVHPIRVGNTENGYSGDHYNDQKELTWEEIGIEAETTTVTGRKRRIFSFSKTQIESALLACGPDEIFLNFCNYNPTEAMKVAKEINKLAKWVLGAEDIVKYLGYGPTEIDIAHDKEGNFFLGSN